MKLAAPVPVMSHLGDGALQRCLPQNVMLACLLYALTPNLTVCGQQDKRNRLWLSSMLSKRHGQTNM